MEESLAISRRLEDPVLVNRSQLGLLQVLVVLGELETVPSLCIEARELSRQLDDPWAEHFADHFIADCALMQGDYPTAAAHYARSLDAAARSGDRIESCFELQGVAMASAGRGRLAGGPASEHGNRRGRGVDIDVSQAHDSDRKVPTSPR
jgi:hypothetical protein